MYYNELISKCALLVNYASHFIITKYKRRIATCMRNGFTNQSTLLVKQCFSLQY